MILWSWACVPFNPTEEAIVPTPPPMVGAEGGVVRGAGGAELDIPAGALDEPVEIRIIDTEAAPPEGYEGLSTVWSFEPDGLVFAEPVTVSIPYTEHSLPRMFWSEGEGYESIDAVFADGTATAQIEHFSTGFVSIIPSEIYETDVVRRPADVLFVVDNSCSMFEEQQQLAENIPEMFAAYDDSELDYHLGVVSTDMDDTQNHAGKLRRIGTESYISPATQNGANMFSLMANMGTSGSYEEKGRTAAWTMVEVKRDIPRNSGFYRHDATLDIIFVSDEEDQSGGNPLTFSEFVDWMVTLKPAPEDVAAHGIVGLAGSGCPAVDTPGLQYVAAADATDGVVVDLCEADWTDGLTEIADRRAQDIQVTVPVEVTEIVSVHFLGASPADLEPSAYTVVESTVFLDQGVVPASGDSVQVVYRGL